MVALRLEITVRYNILANYFSSEYCPWCKSLVRRIRSLVELNLVQIACLLHTVVLLTSCHGKGGEQAASPRAATLRLTLSKSTTTYVPYVPFKSALSAERGPGPHLIHCSLGPPLDDILIGSSVFVGLTIVTDGHTDTQTTLLWQ